MRVETIGDKIAVVFMLLVFGGLTYVFVTSSDPSVDGAPTTNSRQQVSDAKSGTFCTDLTVLVNRLTDTMLIEARAGKEPSDDNSRTLANAILDNPQCFTSEEQAKATGILETVNSR